MRTLRALVLLFPLLAAADWRSIATVGGSPQDIIVVDAGLVLAVSSGLDGGATLWNAQGAGAATVVNTLPALTGFVGAGTWAGGCLVGLTQSGAVTPSPGCGSTVALGSTGWSRFRLVSPAPYGLAILTATFDTPWAGPGPATGWTQQSAPLVNGGTRSLQTLHYGDADLALLTGNILRLFIDGGTPTVLDAGTGASWRDAAPFVLAGRPAAMGVVTDGGLTLLPDLSTPLAQPASLPTGVAAAFVTMSSRTGLVTTSTGEVLSPIPDPARIGQVWVRRTGAPAMTGRVHCIDNRWCAGFGAMNEVFLYENRSAPTVSVSIPPEVDAGQLVRLVADAGDGDGDPVYVRWRLDGGVLTPVAGVDDGSAVDVFVPTGSCAPALEVSVTDGLEANDRLFTVPIPVVDRAKLELDAGSMSACGCGQPVAFSVAAIGGCQAPTLGWSTSDGRSGTGASFSYQASAAECAGVGGTVTVTATATWPFGSPSTNQLTSQLALQPWGAPETPVLQSPATLTGGTNATYVVTGVDHACLGAAGFPGTELAWSVDGGGLDFQVLDGGLFVSAPRTCVRLTLTASVVRQLAGAPSGPRSDAGTLVVNVPPELPPIGPATPFLLTAGGDAGVVFGTVDVVTSCVMNRDLRADVVVARGPDVVSTASVGVPSGWSLPVPGGCAGGDYQVTASLFEDGGFTGAVAGPLTVTFLATPARAGTLSQDRLDVACGTGARASLEVLPVADSCASADLSWRAVSGPALVAAAGQGRTVPLETQALDFSVVGQSIALELTADAGLGNVDVVTRTVELGVQPFLEVAVQASPPLRREEEPVSLEVTLRNPTACAAEGLAVLLPISGARALLDSVRVDGQPATALATADGLVLEGVSVPASGEVHVALLAQPRLLSTARVTPSVSLNGYLVSIASPETTPATGCGCTALDAPALLALGLLVLRRRRPRAGYLPAP